MISSAGRAGDEETRPDGGMDGTRDWAIEDVLDAALTTTGAEAAEIFLREPGASTVSLAGFRGPYAEVFSEITRFEEGQGYPGLVAWSGRPLKIVDASTDARFLRTHLTELGFRSFICVPIPGPNRPRGSLDVAWRRGSEACLSHCLTLSREAERLGLLLERLDEGERAATVSPRIQDAADEGQLHLRVLGSFSAARGRTALTIDSFARRRAVTLLKILLTNYGQVVVRDELIDLLWPSEQPKDGAQLLKIVVHYLRRGLGETLSGKNGTSFIVTEAKGYSFNPGSNHSLDALEFENLAEEGFHFERRGRWREALVALKGAADVYGGDYLQEEPYSDWCVKRRRQLREKLFDVLVTAARLLRIAGDYEMATQYYRRILNLDPCLEDVHRDLMEVLYLSGKRTQALRQYEACRLALREEFDVAPVMETESLYRSILAGSNN